MADGPLPVGADHAADGRSLVPANGRVDGAGGRLRTAHAHGPVFPGKAIRVEGAPQAVMDIAAFGHGHEAGGALIQPVHHMKDKVRPSLIGQRSRYGGGIRQEIGGVGRHAGGLVEDQQVLILIDDEIIHGIPGPRVLQEGDIVSIDVGAYIGGYHGDCAATFPCGKVSPEAQNLIDVTRQSFFEGIKFAKEGCRLYDISAAIQGYVESHGCSIVREYVGHGIGTEMHESPEIPNYGHPGRGPRLLRGMTIAVEPMVNAGTAAIRQMPDGWTVRTADGKLAAHYENTLLITDGEPEILTAPAI